MKKNYKCTLVMMMVLGLMLQFSCSGDPAASEAVQASGQVLEA